MNDVKHTTLLVPTEDVEDVARLLFPEVKLVRSAVTDCKEYSVLEFVHDANFCWNFKDAQDESFFCVGMHHEDSNAFVIDINHEEEIAKGFTPLGGVSVLIANMLTSYERFQWVMASCPFEDEQSVYLSHPLDPEEDDWALVKLEDSYDAILQAGAWLLVSSENKEYEMIDLADFSEFNADLYIIMACLD